MVQRTRMHVVVFDLEFTAWEGSLARGWDRPFELKEVVQIGAVKLDVHTLKSVDEFDMLVRPRVNPRLSEYFTRLTGITNAAVAARGVDLAVAYRAFLDFAGGGTAWAFGRDDLIFDDNLRLYALDIPRAPYGNVIPWFAAAGIDLTGKHACDVARAVGAQHEGRDHDALADAHSVAAGVVTQIGRGTPNPFLPS